MSAAAPSPPSDAELHACADGQLAPARRAEIEAMLASDPELAARVASIREQSAALRDALDPLLADPLPERLIAAAAPQPSGLGSFARRWLAPTVAAAATLVLGVGLGWLGRD